jgi:hypothetical protein
VSESSRNQKPPAIETDPRFPSGEWIGFWLQRGWPGKQWMTLAIQFTAGTVTAEGRDPLGEFLFRGSYNLQDGRCTLIKTYPASHQVAYSGANEGDGKWLWGLWKTPGDTGGFHLWPKGEADPTDSNLKAKKQAPVEPKRPGKLVAV